MAELEEFRRLVPEITHLKVLTSEGRTVCWEAYDSSGRVLGYAFLIDVPETILDIEGMEEMDRYRVTGIVDPEGYRLVGLDIALHPEGPEEPWTTEVTEPSFEKQYIGLTVEEIYLAPDGKIDAVTDATLSSVRVTDAIREKIREIIEKTKG